MNYTKIAKLCRKNGIIHIMNDLNGKQWISNGYGAYLISGMPDMTGNEVATFLGFSENDKIRVEEITANDIVAETDGEPLNTFGPELKVFGDEYETFIFGSGAFLVDSALIAPILTKTEKDNNIRYQLERFKKGPCIGVYYGFDKIAVLYPTRLMPEHISRYKTLITALEMGLNEYPVQEEGASGNE